MINDFTNLIDKLDDPVKNRFMELYRLIMKNPIRPEEKLWAKLPTFYAGENFIRLIPFNDHINIEAKAIAVYRGELTGYKITPKGMLSLYNNQTVPAEILKTVFRESLST